MSELGSESGGGGMTTSDGPTGGGSASTADTSRSGQPSSSGRTVGETPDTQAADGGERAETKAEAKAARLYKVRRGGQDTEVDGDELAKRWGDDYEHEFTGPGGKPLKLKWDDVSRAVQLSSGAQARIERASASEAKLQEGREWGRKNIGAYLESQLGVEDHEEWAMDIARQKFQREEELVELQQSNPSEALRRITDGIAKRMERKQQLEQHRAQRDTQQRDQSQAQQSAVTKASEAFKVEGVPWTSETLEIARGINNQYRQADVNLPEADIAKLVKRELHSRRRAEMAALSPADLHSLLGADVITALRAHDVQQLKGVRAEAKAAAPSNGAAPRVEKQYTEGELRRQARAGNL